MLKIEVFSNEIQQLLENNKVNLISTSTGSGKTMYVPWLAHQISQSCVFILMPRVIMAQQAARGVVALGLFKPSEVGILTGKVKKYIPKQTKVCFCTEMSFLNSKLVDKMEEGDFVVIDEIHEAKASTAAILHFSKNWLEVGKNIILLSATVDIEKYKNYYEGFSFGSLNEPESERPYKVVQIESNDPLKACYEAAKEGGRILIGTAGKPEIEVYTKKINQYGKDVKVFPLHGELEVEESDAALSYEGPCIYIATNIVQSGVTLDKLTHLHVDGYGNRIESLNGVSKLTKYLLSEAEMKQWRGRIGRMCDGIEFLDPATNVVREKMPTAEILISPLMETYATFLKMGIAMDDIQLIDQPNSKAIQVAKTALEKLHIVSNGSITTFGQKVLSLGIGVRSGIIESVGETLQIQNFAAKVNTIDQIGHPFRNFYQRSLEPQYSDYVYWIDIIEDFIMRYGYNVSQLDYIQFEEECTKKGIFRKNLNKIIKTFKNIDEQYENIVPSEKKIKCLLYISNLDRIVVNGWLNDTYIVLSNKSVIQKLDICFGNIVSIGNKTFIEGATSISLEEKEIFDKLF